ncbi:hypothetical protein SteCoe_14181 [Stentor coeruleus]|uniref:cGMP-dependent protein kinase n=1 Tax=Stentor coeruleus TaxID=5963 RepID=A0A1R2C6L3_9CILI|nr:hypothetical protein SteCoe_14181 [Stentor coeruleus]
MGSTCSACGCPPQSENIEKTSEIIKAEPLSEECKTTQKKSRKRKNKKHVLRSHLAEKYVEASSAVISNKKKSESDIKMIEAALSTHCILKNIDNDGKTIIIDEMKHYSIGAKEIIFEQGNPAECFFVLVGGKLEVLVNDNRVNIIKPGTGFGELALIDNCARSATVRTIEKSILWGLDRKTFKKSIEVLNASNYSENRQFLDSVPLFQILTRKQKELIMTAMTYQLWAAGEKIIKEGDTGDSLFIIKDGQVSCTQKGIEIRQLAKGNFFGEQALLNNCVRTATITAITDTKVISIGSTTIVKVLGGNLEQVLYKNTIVMSFEKSPVFRALTEEQLKKIIEHMKIMQYQDGETVICQGLPMGKHIWVVLKHKLRQNTTLIDPFTCIGDEQLLMKDSQTFKESYLAEGVVVTAEISKEQIEEILGGKIESVFNQNDMLPILRKVSVLRYLSKSKFQSVVRAFKIIKFNVNEIIFCQNDQGDKFYIIKSGKVDIIKDGTVVRSINIHDYFGERSILFNDTRSASAVANTEVVCWVLDRSDFLRIVDENIRKQLISRIELQDDSIVLNDLLPVKLLGKGMFGCVYLTAHKEKETQYALKTVTRQKIASFDIFDNVILERKILLQLDHCMIVKLIKTFKDNLRLYFLMEYVRGMDLFDVLTFLGKLSQKNGAFYTACLVLIIENLHEREIVYRDLKPENVMVDEEGYLKLIDFGTAKFVTGKTYTTVGTPHYMAPEVITGSGYTQTADLWSLGVMAYEFFEGVLPFGENEEEPYKIYEKVLEHKLVFKKILELKSCVKNFIHQLLSVNPINRTEGDMKTHIFFEEINWDRLLAKETPSPYKPKVNSVQNDVVRAKKLRKNLQEFISREEILDNQSSRRCFKPASANWDEEF